MIIHGYSLFLFLPLSLSLPKVISTKPLRTAQYFKLFSNINFFTFSLFLFSLSLALTLLVEVLTGVGNFPLPRSLISPLQPFLPDFCINRCTSAPELLPKNYLMRLVGKKKVHFDCKREREREREDENWRHCGKKTFLDKKCWSIEG